MSSNKSQPNATYPVAVPKHVAIIMDGNGRWAKQLGKMRISGHKEGAKAVRKAVTFAVSHNLSALTLYAFSSENWNRPAQEVSALMELFFMALDKEVKKLHKNNVRLRIIGDVSRFSDKLKKKIQQSEELTKNNDGLTLNIAANYGGRWDIIEAAKAVAQQVVDNELSVDEIDESALSQHICLNDLPPVDLVIRTGGEHRISNFLLWQIAYAEFYFTEVLWPDFDELVFEGAMNAFAQRERRFGGTEPLKS